MKKITQNGRLAAFLIYIRSSLWFAPTLIIIGAAGLAAGLVTIDQYYGDNLKQWSPELFNTKADAARGMLETIAGSMITVAGVVFSITIVVLALASSQYTSRVLRNFMRDRANQIVLGVFIGVYIYCLLVLRTVSQGDWTFVPVVSVLVGILLAIVAVGFFIFFIHHISTTIQLSEIASSITKETLQAIERLFPDEIGAEPDEAEPTDTHSSKTWYAVPALNMGYIQSVDPDGLLDFAREHDTVVRMECSIGDFLGPGRPLVSILLDEPPDEALIVAINDIYAVAPYRTIDQDAEFGIRQLVDISLKALSPGVNDTTTAVICIEHLSVLLSCCARRGMPSPHRFEREQLRVIARGPSFKSFLSLAFAQILESSQSNSEIMKQLLLAIERIAQMTNNPQRLEVLRYWVSLIEEVAVPNAKSSRALQEIEMHLARTRTALKERDPLYAMLHDIKKSIGPL